MTQLDPDAENCTVHDDIPSYADRLGTDANGREHLFAARDGRVYVLRRDVVVRIEDLDDRPVADWVDFVDAQLGWTDCQYVDDWSAYLAERLAEAV